MEKHREEINQLISQLQEKNKMLSQLIPKDQAEKIDNQELDYQKTLVNEISISVCQPNVYWTLFSKIN